ncbi:MAG: hypothetical protein JSV85_00120 [Candidatus Bathyarchaeota archaeon]|nr:MAG: hypothetical protein JSV85_00120 [Candidatus Bathyarchaeota archaeon]
MYAKLVNTRFSRSSRKKWGFAGDTSTVVGVQISPGPPMHAYPVKPQKSESEWHAYMKEPTEIVEVSRVLARLAYKSLMHANAIKR